MNLFEQIALSTGQEITGPSDYVFRLRNSVIIAGLSTIFSVILGLLAAYAFSRFEIPGKNDLLFFILSTRMLPAVVVTIPLFLMFRQLSLHDTHLGMILLYTVFNLSFAVWLLKGFLDDSLAACAEELYGPAAVLGRMKELWSYLHQSLSEGERLWQTVRICRTLDEYARAVDIEVR